MFDAPGNQQLRKYLGRRILGETFTLPEAVKQREWAERKRLKEEIIQDWQEICEISKTGVTGNEESRKKQREGVSGQRKVNKTESKALSIWRLSVWTDNTVMEEKKREQVGGLMETDGKMKVAKSEAHVIRDIGFHGQ